MIPKMTEIVVYNNINPKKPLCRFSLLYTFGKNRTVIPLIPKENRIDNIPPNESINLVSPSSFEVRKCGCTKSKLIKPISVPVYTIMVFIIPCFLTIPKVTSFK
jgi:hypothetical protein